MQINPGRHHFRKPIDRHREKLDVVEAFQLADPVGKKRRHPGHVATKGFEPPRLHLLDTALRYDEGALPVIAAVEHDHHLTRFDVAEGFAVVGGLAR